MCYFSGHNHTSYSNASRGFPDSINRIEDLVDRAMEIGLTGMSITEHECLSSHYKLLSYRDKLQNEDKLGDFTIALGDEIYLTEDLEPGQKYYHHLLTAKTALGHKILRMISSQAWENSFTDRGLVRTPITREQLKDIMVRMNGRGHIVSSTACIGSYEAQAFLRIKAIEEAPGAIPDAQKQISEQKQNVVDFVNWNLDVFGADDFYLEIAPNSSEEQRYVNKRTWVLGQSMNVPVIFTTDSHYLSEEDREIHKAYLNSKQAEREVDDFYWTAYMMQTEQVKKYLLLDFSEDEFGQMVDNLEKIRSGIESYSLSHEQEIPRVPVNPPALSSEYTKEDLAPYKYLTSLLESSEEQDRYWSTTCLNELVKRGKNNARYLNQLDIESNTLVKVSERLKQPMTSYYNTAQKIIDIIWNEGNSLVGISRGSALGFLSNWLLDITQIDPLEYFGDLSWRHLSEHRAELPKRYWASNVNPAQGCLL